MESKMKTFGFIFFFSLFTNSLFGQQFLWSTVKKDSVGVKYVSVENVTMEVLEFYDTYKYYYDGAGFSKDGFFKSFEGSQSYKNSSTSQWKDLKKKIYEINELTVFAFRANLGQGSAVLVLCVSKENVNMVTFSNVLESNFNISSQYNRNKFIKWFMTLLN